MPGRTESKPSPWLNVLLVAGVLLTLLILLVLLTDSPYGLWVTALSLSPWGPIMLVAWAVIARYQRRRRRLEQLGISGRATVMSIHTTSSAINGRPVLRLDLSVAVAGRPFYNAAVRTAPPSHLVGMLRPTVSLPVKVDPQYPDRLMVDWPKAEWETRPDTASSPPQ